MIAGHYCHYQKPHFLSRRQITIRHIISQRRYASIIFAAFAAAEGFSRWLAGH